jgi:integrase/recombinase XerC
VSPTALMAVSHESASTMHDLLADYLRHLALERHASAHTVKSYREDLTQAVGFFQTQLPGSALAPQQLTSRILRAYLAWLHEQGYARTTVARRLAAVRSWLRFLCRQGVLSKNPADGLRGPRTEKRLPHFMAAGDVGKLVAAPARTTLGSRDRAILETLYSAGLRVSELVGVNIDDLDLDGGVLTVRGKGKKERLALLGGPAAGAVRAWLTGSRPAASPECWKNTLLKPGSTAEPARTPCGTRLPPTWWMPGPTSAACRNCSAIGAWVPRRYTPM